MIAEKFLEDTIYFPTNMDFRGRAYPMPPNLNHLGSDLCRGMLLFDQGKPLGKDGLSWLKIHICNLFGNNKISQTEREKWADEHMSDINDSAQNPLDGKRWWCTAEEPFQALATCMEIFAATQTSSPETFLSRLPVHQDGSCNGLQHYAALGRDEVGGKAVNLISSDRPQDVYSGVLKIVLGKLDEACSKNENDEVDAEAKRNIKLAHMLRPVTDRGVVKQTVMTSVYGVTRIGARDQINNRLMERFKPSEGEIMSTERESEIYEMSMYLSGLVIESIGEMFSSAKAIMEWLAECSSLVSKHGEAMSWITPLGLPVIQPYRKYQEHRVKTVLQTITLGMTLLRSYLLFFH